ncbi:hypothetical protein Tco_0089659 [Tanacetum coccineum]
MDEHVRLKKPSILSVSAVEYDLGKHDFVVRKIPRYGKTEYYENEDNSFMNLETEYPAIVFDDISDAALSCKPTVSPLDNNEIDFNISFDESDDEDYMIVFDENTFSCKIIYVDNLKTDSENENHKINIPSSPSPEPTIGYFDDLDFFKDFKNEFLAIVYNDLKSKSDPLNEPSDLAIRKSTLCVHRIRSSRTRSFTKLAAPELVVSQNSQLQNSQFLRTRSSRIRSFSEYAAPKLKFSELAVFRIRSSQNSQFSSVNLTRSFPVPIYDEEPMAEVQTTAEINVFTTRQQHTEQPEFNNEGKVDHNAEQCHDTCPFPAKLTDNQKTKLSYQSLKSENILKSNEAKIKHDIDVIETINIELEHKVAKLLKENKTLKRNYKELSDSIKTTRAKTIECTTSLIEKNYDFKAQLQEKGFAIAALKNELRKLSGNSVKAKFAKQSILKKPILQPHRNQSVVKQPTAFKSERPRISKPRYSSNDMVHNHYLEEAKTKTQESNRNSEPGVIPSARSQSTANGSKPKPRINNQNSRNWLASKSSCVTTKTVPIAEHPRNSRNFSDSKHFVCSTFQKCVFNANHEYCVTKFLNEVNSRKIFKTVSLRWVPTGKIFTSNTTKVDSESPNGLDEDITNQYEYEQTLNVCACTLNLSAELRIYDHINEPSSSKLVPKVVTSADTTAPSKQELDLLFGPLYNEFFTAELVTPTITITAEDNM